MILEDSMHKVVLYNHLKLNFPHMSYYLPREWDALWAFLLQPFVTDFDRRWTAWSKTQEILSSSCTYFIACDTECLVSIEWSTGRQASRTIFHASPLCLTAAFLGTMSKASSPFRLLQGFLIQVAVSGLIQIMFIVQTRESPLIIVFCFDKNAGKGNTLWKIELKSFLKLTGQSKISLSTSMRNYCLEKNQEQLCVQGQMWL